MNKKLRELKSKGFFHIFGANVINKVIQFSSGIILVRILSKEQFGLFTYAENIIMFFILFASLGVDAGLLQYGSESEDNKKRNEFFRYSLKIGISFNFLISILILLFSNLVSLNIEGANTILGYMFLLPLLMGLFQLIQIYFRVSLENKKFSSLSTVNTFLIFILTVLGAYYFEVIGVVIFKYFAYIISAIFGIFLFRKELKGIIGAVVLPKPVKKEFIKFSLISALNNGIAKLLYILDIFLIGLIIADETIIAAYKTATLIPFALNFIPSSIVTFIYPYFARNNNNKSWIKKNYIKLVKYLFLINLLITSFLIVFAPFIINLLFGKEYHDALVPFIILSIGYFIAGTFRIPTGNVLLMIKEVKFNMYLAIATGLINIILDIILIINFGSVGAAITTVSIFIISSIVSVFYLLYKLKE
ncbi:oligosaccharide flippase family protein [Ureibacillus chungkukjangi]|uniref:oligosaccharide flippase family protein n=1 Tax=Ureibacillus chungkukjangi TaxID=1202712 RepID=UPI002040ABE7|nr:oligosaccharide flippase family protein [Ureibacillus chungkukjangi]MCM3386848.1 oligosaccharide flippase family protein [Ureibacillus chungkukjangi]